MGAYARDAASVVGEWHDFYMCSRRFSVSIQRSVDGGEGVKPARLLVLHTLFEVVVSIAVPHSSKP